MRGALLTTKRARRFVATVARTIQDQAAQGPSSNGTPSPGDAAQAAAKGAAAEAAKKSAKKASGGSLKTWWKQFDKAGRELSAAVVKKVRYFIFFFEMKRTGKKKERKKQETNAFFFVFLLRFSLSPLLLVHDTIHRRRS